MSTSRNRETDALLPKESSRTGGSKWKVDSGSGSNHNERFDRTRAGGHSSSSSPSTRHHHKDGNGKNKRCSPQKDEDDLDSPPVTPTFAPRKRRASEKEKNKMIKRRSTSQFLVDQLLHNPDSSNNADRWSRTVKNRDMERSGSAWFAELADEADGHQRARYSQPEKDCEGARAAEEYGDMQFDRIRTKLFEKSKKPHRFTQEERRRMDGYESIDYSEPQSLLYKVHMSENGGHQRWLRWVFFILVGIIVGLWSVLLLHSLDQLAEEKVEVTAWLTESRRETIEKEEKTGNPDSSLYKRTPSGVPVGAALEGYIAHIAWSVLAAILSSLCCVVVPSAAGSGVPDVMAYLNGISMPRIFNVRNLVVKTLSCLFAVNSGMPVGSEGPLIHIGSLIGAGLPTGRSRSLHCSIGSGMSSFRNPKDIRDFISAGAACGMTSAFSCPIGGLLFVMEEMATFFGVRLAWLVFVACLACMTTIQIINTYLSGWMLAPGISTLGPGNIRPSAISMFTVKTLSSERIPMNLYTLLPTVLIAIPMAFLAVAYTMGSVRCTRWRSKRLFPHAILRVMEPCIFVSLYATVAYCLPFLLPCVTVTDYVKENKDALRLSLVSFMCEDQANTYSPLGTLMLSSSYNGIRLLYSRRTYHMIPWYVCLIHLTVYSLGSIYAGGMFIACGTVIPSFVIGAVGGRLIGQIFGRYSWADPGVLALIGTASYFAGVSRLTFSLIVIVVELTSDLTHMPCLMVGVIIAKAIADRFCHSFYHSLLEVKAAPFLEAQSDVHKFDMYSAKHIMTSPVVTLCSVEKLVDVMDILQTTTHNAFPVVTTENETYRGMVPRSQLELLVWFIFIRDAANGEESIPGTITDLPLHLRPHATYADLKATQDYLFAEDLPALPPTVYLPLETLRSAVDLSPYVDIGAYFVMDAMCISRTYYIFRHMGLRHLPVLDRNHKVVGIVTRTNLVGDRLYEKMEAAEEAARMRRPNPLSLLQRTKLFGGE